MRLFIDANIYLNYFRRSDASLSSLEELEKLLKQNKLKLVLPNQTRDEYFRNRNGIAEKSRELLCGAAELKVMLPAPFIRAWPEATLVRKRVDATRKAYERLLRRFDATVSKERTPADILIKRLFAAAEVLEDDKELLNRAYFRYLRGHPPRKNDGSLGDAIMWELLLARVRDRLVVITKDTDFSEMRKGVISFNGFLEREWRATNRNKSIELYDSLGEFINAIEKREAVKKEVVQKEKSLDTTPRLNAVVTYNTGGVMNTASYVTGPSVLNVWAALSVRH
jgi:hypothetical protein